MASGKELRFLEIGIVFIYVLLFESFLYSFSIKMKEKKFFFLNHMKIQYHNFEYCLFWSKIDISGPEIGRNFLFQSQSIPDQKNISDQKYSFLVENLHFRSKIMVSPCVQELKIWWFCYFYWEYFTTRHLSDSKIIWYGILWSFRKKFVAFVDSKESQVAWIRKSGSQKWIVLAKLNFLKYRRRAFFGHPNRSQVAWIRESGSQKMDCFGLAKFLKVVTKKFVPFSNIGKNYKWHEFANQGHENGLF